MEEFKYIKPEQSSLLKEDRSHKFEVTIGDENIGYANIKYTSKPFPFYYVKYLKIEDDHRGKKYGRGLLLQVNNFIEERGRPGILLNGINRNQPEIRGMYERNGWEKTKTDPSYLTYNLPKDFDPVLLNKALKMIDYKEFDMY